MLKVRLSALLVLLFSTSICAQNTGFWDIQNPYISRTDAAFGFSSEYACLISNTQMLYQPMIQMGGVEASELSLPQTLFPQPNTYQKPSAAISVEPNVFLLFKGNTYVPIDKGTLEPLAQPAVWIGWPGFWKNDIDAALQWGDGSFVFIKGLQYVSYNNTTGQTSTPQQMNRWSGWPSSWSGSIDAAFNGQDGFLYFIRKGEILAMNAQTMQFAPGYPKSMKASAAGSGMMGQQSYTYDPSATEQYEQEKSQPKMETVDLTLGWCAVGTPDPATIPVGESITPYYTRYAGAEKEGTEFKDLLPSGSRVSEIRVWGDHMIEGIELVTQSKRGFISENGVKGTASGKAKVFKLYPGECLSAIEGTWGGRSGDYIYTLSFVTTERRSPVFGGEDEKGTNYFKFEIPHDASFAGFAGTHSHFLESLGLKYFMREILGFDENGQLTQMTRNIDSYNEDQGRVVVVEEGDKDPYFDDFVDPINNTEEHLVRDAMTFSNYKIPPSMDWIGRTVDYTKIDPMDISGTPRFPKGVFTMVPSAYHKKNMGGDTWLLPWGIDENKSPTIGTGELQASTQTFTSFDSYTKDWTAKAGVKAGFKGVAEGSVNTAHRQRKTEEIGTERMLIQRRAQIASYALYFNLHWVDDHLSEEQSNARQKLSREFRKAVENLPVPYGSFNDIAPETMNKNTRLPEAVENVRAAYLNQIINVFGTHYMNSIEMGGTFIHIMSVSKEELRKARLTKSEIEAEFEVTIKGFTGGASGGYEETNESENVRTKSDIKIEVISKGAGGQIGEEGWSAGVNAQPVPIKYELFYLSDILSEVFFPFDEEIDLKRRALEMVINKYIVDNSVGVRNPLAQFDFNETFEEIPDSATVKFEVLRIRTLNDGNDGDRELLGSLKCLVQGSNEREVTNWTYWSGNGEKYKEKEWHTLNKTIKLKTDSKEITEFVLNFYGVVEDEDSGSDEDLFMASSQYSIPTTCVIPVTELIKKGASTGTKTLKLKDDEDNGEIIEIQYKLTWI